MTKKFSYFKTAQELAEIIMLLITYKTFSKTDFLSFLTLIDYSIFTK